MKTQITFVSKPGGINRFFRYRIDYPIVSLAQFAGEDPVVALEAALQFEDTRESMHAFCVGQYIEVKMLLMGKCLLKSSIDLLSDFLLELSSNLQLLFLLCSLTRK